MQSKGIIYFNFCFFFFFTTYGVLKSISSVSLFFMIWVMCTLLKKTWGKKQGEGGGGEEKETKELYPSKQCNITMGWERERERTRNLCVIAIIRVSRFIYYFFYPSTFQEMTNCNKSTSNWNPFFKKKKNLPYFSNFPQFYKNKIWFKNKNILKFLKFFKSNYVFSKLDFLWILFFQKNKMKNSKLYKT